MIMMIISQNSAKPILSKKANHLDQTGHFEVNTGNMQMQNGFIDCGLYAIATFFGLCLNPNPAAIRFKQSVMRPYLHSCFNNVKIEESMYKNSLD